MKKAFSMIELVFVIVVIGILSASLIPNLHRDKTREAAEQVVTHIRYTQHLALVDDKYNAADSHWFNRRWEIAFSNGANTNNKWSYTIFSDILGNATGSSDPQEVALNPLDTTKRLTGGANGNNLIHTGDAEATASMNIGETYGVTNVQFSSSCSYYSSMKIAFDHLGRPMKGAMENYTKPYPAANRLVTQQCIISLVGSDETVQIAIEPETGYAHIIN